MLETYMNVDYLLHSTFVVAPTSFSNLHFYNRFPPFQQKTYGILRKMSIE